MQRILQHLLFLPWRMRQMFTKPVLAAIEREIAVSETRHRGEIRVAVEASLNVLELLRGKTARQRALEVFSNLGVWDTQDNNGVLIYLLLAEHRVEIVADRGIQAKVTPEQWLVICHKMQASLRIGNFEEGVCAGIHDIGEYLIQHFPAQGANQNELPNKPVLL